MRAPKDLGQAAGSINPRRTYMSLDNVRAVAGAAREHLRYCFGLTVVDLLMGVPRLSSPARCRNTAGSLMSVWRSFLRRLSGVGLPGGASKCTDT